MPMNAMYVYFIIYGIHIILKKPQLHTLQLPHPSIWLHVEEEITYNFWANNDIPVLQDVIYSSKYSNNIFWQK